MSNSKKLSPTVGNIVRQYLFSGTKNFGLFKENPSLSVMRKAINELKANGKDFAELEKWAAEEINYAPSKRGRTIVGVQPIGFNDQRTLKVRGEWNDPNDHSKGVKTATVSFSVKGCGYKPGDFVSVDSDENGAFQVYAIDPPAEGEDVEEEAAPAAPTPAKAVAAKPATTTARRNGTAVAQA